MKARIIGGGQMFYYGQVLVEEVRNGKVVKEWETVTNQCFTRIGAKKELNDWKRKNGYDEFEL